MSTLQDHKAFWGSGLELAEKATLCARELKIDGEKINLRLVRYYASENVINRPDRLGKEAAYGYLHLLQLLTARRMLGAGTPLAVIKLHTQSASIQELEKALLQNDKIEPKQIVQQLASERSFADFHSNVVVRASSVTDIFESIKSLEASISESLTRQKQLSAAEMERLTSMRVMTRTMIDRAQKTLELSEESLSTISKRMYEMECVTREALHELSQRIDKFICLQTEHMLEQQYKSDNTLGELRMSMEVLHKKIDDLGR
jgi:hypothetical protein